MYLSIKASKESSSVKKVTVGYREGSASVACLSCYSKLIPAGPVTRNGFAPGLLLHTIDGAVLPAPSRGLCGADRDVKCGEEPFAFASASPFPLSARLGACGWRVEKVR